MKKLIFCCVAFGLASAFAASRPLTIGRSACEEKVEPGEFVNFVLGPGAVADGIRLVPVK